MKKYISFTLKGFVPFFVISAAIFFVISLTLFTSVSVYHEYYQSFGELEYDSSLNYSVVIIIVMALLLFAFTAISPIIANSYRYSLRSADFYNQICKGHKNVRLVNNLILLIAVLISFTFGYIFGVTVLGIKNVILFNKGTITETFGDSTYIKEPFMYHLAYFIPIYFILLIGGVVNYFISYFLTTRANNALNSVIMLVFGQVILIVGLMTPVWYLTVVTDGGIAISYLFGVKTPSMVSIVALATYLFGDLLRGGSFDPNIFTLTKTEDYIGLVICIISVILFFALGAFSIMKFLKEEETTGELAGKPQGRDKLQSILFHTGAGLIGFWYLCLSASLDELGLIGIIGIFSFIPSIVVYGALYYVFYGLLRRNFRLTKKDLALLLPIFIANVAFGVASIILNNAFYVEY